MMCRSASRCFVVLFVLGVVVGVNAARIQPSQRCHMYIKMFQNEAGISQRRMGVPEIQQLAAVVDDGVDLTEAQALALVHKFDTDGDDRVSIDEWCLHNPSSGIQELGQSPEQVHLMVTPKVDEMRVIWVTFDNTTDSTVQYGAAAGSMNESAAGFSYTYQAGTLFPFEGRIHNVLLTGLAEATRYNYRVGSVGDNVWSQQFDFVTRSAKPAAQLRFALIADMGTVIPSGWQVTDMLYNDHLANPFDFLLHAGDLAYAGTGETDEYEFIWNMFGNQLQPLAANIPYMTSVGNHEHYFDYASFLARYRMPGPETGGNTSFWWSQDYGLVHITSMSTEHPYTPGSPQYEWIVNDLAAAAANRANVPWIFLSGHRPMYCSDVSEWDSHCPGAPFQATIEPLMVQYGVDAYLSGHMHMYERTFPVIGNTTYTPANSTHYDNPPAPWFIVQGNSGAFMTETYVDPQPAWSAVRLQHFGYGAFTVQANSLFYESKMFDTFDKDVDEFTGDTLLVTKPSSPAGSH